MEFITGTLQPKSSYTQWAVVQSCASANTRCTTVLDSVELSTFRFQNFESKPTIYPDKISRITRIVHANYCESVVHNPAYLTSQWEATK